MEQDTDSDKTIKTKCITISSYAIFSSAINGIVAYIAVYFFKPLWEKIMYQFRGRNE